MEQGGEGVAVSSTLGRSSSPVPPGVHPGLFLRFSCWLRCQWTCRIQTAFSFLSILGLFLPCTSLNTSGLNPASHLLKWPYGAPMAACPGPSAHACPSPLEQGCRLHPADPQPLRVRTVPGTLRSQGSPPALSHEPPFALEVGGSSLPQGCPCFRCRATVTCWSIVSSQP